jgi:hypothetical protein|tara:strand:- start:2533 stop:2727 length:195 start_codon:yes stop_codon:yes gene_type:complete
MSNLGKNKSKAKLESKKKSVINQNSSDNNSLDQVIPTSKERGGPKGPEPTRYGDWERAGRCIDF